MNGTSVTIPVRVYGDRTKENQKSFYLNLSNLSAGVLMARGQGLGTIVDAGAATGAAASSAIATTTAVVSGAPQAATVTSAFVSVESTTTPAAQPTVQTGQTTVTATPAAATASHRATAATDRSLAELADVDLSLDITLGAVLDDLVKV
jgi:hypothetical protein